ncbi:MAG: ATP-dependent helicase [Clostridium sp.]|nr:ATP-dependent helicase [Clostridium sp.]
MAFNETQKKAIRHGEGPMLVLAGPGSGKTTVITNRVRYLTEKSGVDPSCILVITFTRAAAREMKERYEQMTQAGAGRVSFGTFHSVFFLMLKLAYRYQAANIVKEEQRIHFVKEALEGCDLEVEDEGEFISAVLSEISMVKGELLNLDYYYAKNCSEAVFKKLYHGYEERLRKSGLLDFDDMLVMCYELLKEREDILAAWQNKYRYILIDEFQDINRIQYEIVKMLARPRNNLFIVGDDDQSIYRFRGAKPEIMLGFERDYPDAKTLLLDTNYRSSRQIVEAAGRVISHNRTRFPKKIRAARGDGRDVIIREWPSPSEENLAIASELRDYYDMGVPYENMAVLYRTNLGPRLLVEKLMEYNIPFRMRDALPNLYDHWIARNVLAYIKAASGDLSRANILTIINRPKRYISRDALEHQNVSWEAVKSFYQDKNWMLDRIEQLEYDLMMIRNMAPGAAVNYIRKAVDYDGYIREYAQDRRMKPEELMEALDQLQESASGFKTSEEWFAHMEAYKEQLLRRSRSRDETGTGVSLMTMHSAKGLEYQVVYILDANEGISPHHRAVLNPDVEEERRMFYVAMTRAKERLHLYYVKERYHKKQEVSRFVEEVRE